MTVTHKMHRSPTWNSWRAMKERCGNPNNSHYASYGGRGIGFPAAWNEFDGFLATLGTRPIGTTLERRDNGAPYSVDNCYWATTKQQARNTTRTVHITWGGETLCRKDWATRLGVTDSALLVRIRRFGLEIAMTMKRYAQVKKSGILDVGART